MKIKYTIQKLLLKAFVFLGSLRFAVINLILLGIISAIGTFYESSYDLQTAQILVYRSVWMYLCLAMLSINLAAVLIKKWPWKKRHISFILAHFGILILIIGSLITQVKGRDGSLRLAVGEDGRSITLSSELFIVYSSFDGKKLTELYRFEPHFIKNPPNPDQPHKIFLGTDKQLIIKDYYPYASEKINMKPAADGGDYIQFSLKGGRAQISQSIYKRDLTPFVSKPVGLAHVVLSDGSYKPSQRNEIILQPFKKNRIKYTLVSKGKVIKKGHLKQGMKLKTGWMDLEFQLLSFSKARKEYKFTKINKPVENSTSAIQVQFIGQNRWLRLNSFLSFYSKEQVYIVGYMNQKLPLGMNINLKNFKVTRYPGSSKAKEYESLVQVDHQPEDILISMNEPLTHKGWTIYQSGFEEDEEGQAIASIFAVNRDPGRYIKYFGSLLIVAGIFALFYLKRRRP